MKEIDIHTPGTHLVTVAKVDDAVKAELIRNALQERGIRCELGGEHQAGFTGALDVEVIVREQDSQAAAEIIATLFPHA
jgi:hypothetical protein